MNAIVVIVYVFLILVGVVSLANILWALLDYPKIKTFRIIYFPQEARLIDSISTILMVFVVIAFILDILRVIPAYSGFYALLVWVLYDSSFSLYYRIRKQIAERR